MANLGFEDEDVLRPVRATTGNQFSLRRTRPAPSQGFRTIGFYSGGLPPTTVPNPLMGNNPITQLPPEPEIPAPTPEPAPQPTPETPTFGGGNSIDVGNDDFTGAGAVPTLEDAYGAVGTGFGMVPTGPSGLATLGIGLATGELDPLATHNNPNMEDPEGWAAAVAQAQGQLPPNARPQQVTALAANIYGQANPQWGGAGGGNAIEQTGPTGTQSPGINDQEGIGTPVDFNAKPSTPSAPAPTSNNNGGFGNANDKTNPGNGTGSGSSSQGGNYSDARDDPGGDGPKSGGPSGGGGGFGGSGEAPGGMGYNKGGMVRNYNTGGVVPNGAPPPDMDPDQFELQQARAAVTPQPVAGHPDAARFQATPGQVANDGRVDDEQINADEGEAVIQAAAAQQYSPESLAAMNDPSLVPMIEQAVQEVIMGMQQQPGQQQQVPPSAGGAMMARSAPSPMAARPRSMISRVG